VTLLYADTSAVVRAYFADEADHKELRGLLFDGPDPVVTSELTRVEFASAVSSASRARRTEVPRTVLDRFDLDCGEDGPFALLRLDSAVVLPYARRLVAAHAVRTLDAIHLAVALTDATALAPGEEVKLVTRDRQQATVARAAGLPVYQPS
jgi:predicted nucleic acid-binding protein